MKEDRFGKYTKDVEEVLDFAFSDKVLSGGRLPDDIDAVVIDDLDKIPTEDDYDKYGDGVLYWQDILANASSKYYSIKFEKWEKFPYNKFLEENINEQIKSFLLYLIFLYCLKNNKSYQKYWLLIF